MYTRHPEASGVSVAAGRWVWKRAVTWARGTDWIVCCPQPQPVPMLLKSQIQELGLIAAVNREGVCNCPG